MDVCLSGSRRLELAASRTLFMVSGPAPSPPYSNSLRVRATVPAARQRRGRCRPRVLVAAGRFGTHHDGNDKGTGDRPRWYTIGVQMIGRTIGNYVVRAKVGEGGMGVVYKAEHPQLNRRVAIKVLHPGTDRNPEAVHRFFNEARAARDMRDEHVVQVLDFGEMGDGAHYLVMEWLEGQSLGDVLRAQPWQSVARTATIVPGIARALRAAHASGVVHRDLKPDNVFLVDRNGESDFVKVLDFGIAKLIQASDPNSYQTQTGALVGTPAYMSPEQCRGARDIDTRTDVYSLGVIAYEMLTGRLPFTAGALGELLFKHLTEQPDPPISLRPDVPAAVSEIVSRALEKEPERRPTLDELVFVMERTGPATSAARVASAGDEFPRPLIHEGCSLMSPKSPDRARLGIGKGHSPRAATVVALVALTLGTVVTVVSVVVRQPPAERPAASAVERPVERPVERAAEAVAATAPPAQEAAPPVVPSIRAQPGKPGAAPFAIGDRPVGERTVAPATGTAGARTSREPRPRRDKGATPLDGSATILAPPDQSLPTGYRGSQLKIETDFP